MNIISGIVQNLVILAFLSLFLEILLPSGEIKKYAKFVMGVMVLIVVINPLLQSFDEGMPELSAAALGGEVGLGDVSAILEEGDELNAELTAAAEAQLEASMVKQIKAMVGVIEGVEAVVAEVEVEAETAVGVELVLTLAVGADGAPLDADRVQQIRRKAESLITDFYGIDSSMMRVSIGTLAE